MIRTNASVPIAKVFVTVISSSKIGRTYQDRYSPKKIKANIDFYLAEYRTDQQVRDERVQKQKSKRAGVENIHR